MFPRVSIACVMTVSVCLIGCQSEPPIPPDDTPTEMILYSLDPRPAMHDKHGKLLPGPYGEKRVVGGELFHDIWEVLGKSEIKDPAVRKELMEAMQDGIATSDGTYAKCFNPRHGLRVREKDKITDYLICFECGQIEIFTKNENRTTKTTTGAPAEIFNKRLKEANLPLARSAVESEE